MPELPEVEVVKRSLESKIINLAIKKVKINDVNLRYKVTRSELLKFAGGKIVKILRRSKFLILRRFATASNSLRISFGSNIFTTF